MTPVTDDDHGIGLARCRRAREAHPTVLKRLWGRRVLCCSRCPPHRGCNGRRDALKYLWLESHKRGQDGVVTDFFTWAMARRD